MPTYQENREQIVKKVHEIITTHDKEEACGKIADYIISVANRAYMQAASDIEYCEDIELSGRVLIMYLGDYGLIKDKTDKDEN